MNLNTISSFAFLQFGDHLKHPNQFHSLTKLIENIFGKHQIKKPIELSVVRKELRRTEPFPQRRQLRTSMSSSKHSFDHTNSDAFYPPPPYQDQAAGGSGRMFAPGIHDNTTRGMETIFFLNLFYITKIENT